jgi:hypothetical protein
MSGCRTGADLGGRGATPGSAPIVSESVAGSTNSGGVGVLGKTAPEGDDTVGSDVGGSREALDGGCGGKKRGVAGVAAPSTEGCEAGTELRAPGRGGGVERGGCAGGRGGGDGRGLLMTFLRNSKSLPATRTGQALLGKNELSFYSLSEHWTMITPEWAEYYLENNRLRLTQINSNVTNHPPTEIKPHKLAY